jgi:hypothetical protein
MILSPVIRQKFFDQTGAPLTGGMLYSYAAGTTTPQATYTDQTGLTPNMNPVILDANGEANVWLDPALAYKFILKDSNGVTQWSTDQVSSNGLTGVVGWSSTSNYSQGSLVADSLGVGMFYVSTQNNNLSNPLTNQAYWRLIGGNIRTVTTNSILTLVDEIVRSNSTTSALTHILPACSTTPVGKRIIIKDVGTGGLTTSVKGAGTDLVDGNNTWDRTLGAYESGTFINIGTNWDVI